MKKNSLTTNIILIGMMGSGKTTVGQLLSSYLNFTFIDTDQLIEKQQEMSVDDIFNQKGESYFRKLESNIIPNLPKTQAVISCGGGLPVYNDNSLKLNDLGITLYLKANEQSVLKRISTQSGRPLFSSKKEDISNLISKREEVYNKAKYIVNTNDKSPDEVMDGILKILF
ncbi:MAG: shikimate kinase [Flavobacteriales bacterium]|nr:shikimate kinase [Flavobacteriales bacterium]